jgi:hypothetical protein
VTFHTTNSLISHIKRCPKLPQAWAQGAPGAIEPLRRTDGLTQPTLTANAQIKRGWDAKTNRYFQQMWADAVIENALPFSLSESSAVRDTYTYANPLAQLPTRQTVAKDVAVRYEEGEAAVERILTNLDAPFSWSVDAWTSKDMAHSYTGVIASYIDPQLNYHELMLKFLTQKGSHSGELSAGFLAKIFSNPLIAKNLGTPTSDNASNNGTTFAVLDALLKDHVVNLVVTDYIAAINELNPDDLFALTYGSNDAGIDFVFQAAGDDSGPPEYVEGEDQGGTGQEGVDGDAHELVSEPSYLATPYDSGTYDDLDPRGREKARVAKRAADKKAATEAHLRALDSPIGRCRRISKYILRSPQRRDEFKKCFAIKCPDKRFVLPMKDVATRWNWTLHMVNRFLRLRQAIDFYVRSDANCPTFSDADWDALECIAPVLTSFDKVTKQYSAAEPKLHDVLLTYLELKQSFEVNAVFNDEGEAGWVQMVDKASSKLDKYIKLAVANDYVCFAMGKRSYTDILPAITCSRTSARPQLWVRGYPDDPGPPRVPATRPGPASIATRRGCAPARSRRRRSASRGTPS